MIEYRDDLLEPIDHKLEFLNTVILIAQSPFSMEEKQTRIWLLVAKLIKDIVNSIFEGVADEFRG